MFLVTYKKRIKNLPNYGRRHFKLFTDCFVGHPVVQLEAWRVKSRISSKSLLLTFLLNLQFYD